MPVYIFMNVQAATLYYDRNRVIAASSAPMERWYVHPGRLGQAVATFLDKFRMIAGNNDSNTKTWLEEHGDYLFSYAFLKAKDTHVAEDLVQETLLAAITAKNTFSNASTIRTWLVGILKHKLIDLICLIRMREIVWITFLEPMADGLKNRMLFLIRNQPCNKKNSGKSFRSVYLD